MKNQIINIVSVIVLILLFTVSTSYSQAKLIADETTVTQLKSSVKIETCNQEIFKLLYERFKGLGFKYTATIKKDRVGLYTEYNIPFKNEQWNDVVAFFNKINLKTK